MNPNFEYDIEFFDREKEKEEILNILKAKPQFINFIYGPINSGKTALITNLIEELPKDYTIFYINLRGKSIVQYKDFVRVLFAIEEEGFSKKIKDFLKTLLKHIGFVGEKTLYKSHGIPVNKGLLETFFKEKSNEDVFNYLEEYFKNIAKHKIPVLIIDELQVIGDMDIDGKLIYRLFNFFIRLTKELHICHVFALSSDSLFIEKIYNEAMLQGRANFVLVDDFDEETTKKFLEKYKFSKEEQEYIYKNIGGKPGDIINLIYARKTGEEIADHIKEEIESKKNAFLFMFAKNKEKIERILEMFKKFKDNEKINFSKEIDIEILEFLVKNNILFIDVSTMDIKPQSKVDLIAIREILKEMKK